MTFKGFEILGVDFEHGVEVIDACNYFRQISGPSRVNILRLNYRIKELKISQKGLSLIPEFH